MKRLNRNTRSVLTWGVIKHVTQGVLWHLELCPSWASSAPDAIKRLPGPPERIVYSSFIFIYSPTQMSKKKRQPARKHKLLRAAGERKFQAHVNRKGTFPSL